MGRLKKITYAGFGLILLGQGPLFLAEVLRRMGFDTVGFALMWGLSIGLFLTIGGVIVLLYVFIKKFG